MSFLYPRVITISRPASQDGVGFQGYGASRRSEETEVASSLPASIQARGTNRNSVGLPADGRPASYRIFIPMGATVGLGDIQNRDIVTDDLGARYQVTADYWNSLGYSLICDRLEA